MRGIDMNFKKNKVSEARRRIDIPLSSYKRLIQIKARIEVIKGDDIPLCKVVAFLIENHKERILQADELPKFEDSVYAGYF